VRQIANLSIQGKLAISRTVTKQRGFVMRFFVATLSALFFAHTASAQTVQLPTFQFFGVSTSVMVPDNGSAFMGGINRAATGRNEFGIPGLAFPGFQNRSIGQDMSASNVWAHVTIHDFDAMDEAILNSPSPNDFANVSTSRWNNNMNFGLPPVPRLAPSIRRESVNLAGNWRAEPVAQASNVIAEEADRDARRATRVSEADSYFARAEQAEADGKTSVAKIYYQMAMRRASGDFKQQVQARLDALKSRSTSVAATAR
jgi:hypothetical protein